MPIVLPEVTADRSIQPALNVTSPIIDKVDVEPESEDVLRRRILDSLRSSGVATLKNLQVNISGRTVRLSGAVHSAFERQLVLQLAKRECGDFEIQNAIGIVMPKVERTSVLGLMHDAWITYRTQAIAAAAILLAITAYAAPWPQPQPAHTYAVAPECVFEKEPMIGAVIALHPENWTLPEDAIPVGRVTPNGNVVFSTFGDKDGVPAGRYIVTARWSKMTVTKEGDTVTGPELMPAQYRDPATSPIRVDIDSDRPELPVLAFCK